MTAHKSKIAWTGRTWNPVRGCSKVSDGCKHCYAERMAARFCGDGQPYHGLLHNGKWSGEARLIPEMLSAPLGWKKPATIFVNSMSDLFHESLTNEQIVQVYAVMQLAQHHTFQVLTKRPQRAVAWYEWLRSREGSGAWLKAVVGAPDGGREGWSTEWPFRNIHLGVSVENQAAADERIPLLLQCPAAVRWISAEPLLGPIDFGRQCPNECNGECGFTSPYRLLGNESGALIDWVVVGGESGPRARPMHPDWARSLRDQCRSAGVPYFFKQWGEWQVASEFNGWTGSVMHETGERFTWLGFDGKTKNPSHHGLAEPVFAMARAGKKRAGNLLDGVCYEMRPGDKWQSPVVTTED